MEHADFVVVLQDAAAKCAVDPTESAHAERIQFGGSQRADAGAAADRDAALQRKQDFLVPDRRHIAEVAVDETNLLVTRLYRSKHRPECRGSIDVRPLWKLRQPGGTNEHANFGQPDCPFGRRYWNL